MGVWPVDFYSAPSLQHQDLQKSCSCQWCWVLGCSQLLFLGSAAWLSWSRNCKKNKCHGGKLLPSSAAAWLSDPIFWGVAVDPPMLVCGSVCTGLLVLLCTPWPDLCLVLCLVLCSCCIYLCLCVNSRVKDFFVVVVQLYTELYGIIKNCRFQCLPISYDRDELTEGLSNWEPLLCPCLSERREGGQYRMSHRLDELFWQGLTLMYSDVSRHSWMKCNGLKFCDDLCLN